MHAINTYTVLEVTKKKLGCKEGGIPNCSVEETESLDHVHKWHSLF